MNENTNTPAPEATEATTTEAPATPAKPAAKRARKTPATKAPSKASTTVSRQRERLDTKAAKPAAKRTSTRKPAGPTHPGVQWVAILTEANLSQSEAARQMGVAPMTLNRLINGHGIPTANVTLAFARVTKQDPRALWTVVAEYELALAVAAADAKSKKGGK